MTASEEFSLEGARAAAERGELGEWVGRFLRSEGSDNPVLADELSQRMTWWAGPVLLPLDRLKRLAGPRDAQVLCPVDEEEWPDYVEDMAEKAQDGWEPPPVIVAYNEDGYVLEDGNHRVESLRRAEVREVWAVVGLEREEDLTRFTASHA